MQNEFRASWRSSYVSFSKLILKIDFKNFMSIFSLKLKDACVENSIFSKVSLYLKPVGLLITIFLTKWTVKNPIGTFLFTIPFYTLTCGLSCLIIKFAEVSFCSHAPPGGDRHYLRIWLSRIQSHGHWSFMRFWIELHIRAFIWVLVHFTIKLQIQILEEFIWHCSIQVNTWKT